jgi:hypothetical protein
MFHHQAASPPAMGLPRFGLADLLHHLLELLAAVAEALAQVLDRLAGLGLEDDLLLNRGGAAVSRCRAGFWSHNQTPRKFPDSSKCCDRYIVQGPQPP